MGILQAQRQREWTTIDENLLKMHTKALFADHFP